MLWTKRALTALMAVWVLAVGGVAQAQAVVTTPTPNTSGTTASTGSNVAIFYVACLDQGVVNFSGTMLAGYDIYYQLFSGAGGTGTALSTLRRASVDGAYRYSEVIKYTGGTVAAGQTGSVKVLIARESSAENPTYSTTVNDFQDGCAQPQFPIGASTDSGSAPTETVTYTPILSPFGGVLNPGYTPAKDPVVVIGARNFVPPRQETAGLIFAECNQYPIANPGLIYDTDRVVIFWSWFAKTPEQVQDFVDNAIFEVAYFGSNAFVQPVVRSAIQQRGRNWWVFYTIDLGNVRPDNYNIRYTVRWDKQINDGYQLYGPGTAVERIDGNCDFRVIANPEGKKVSYSFP
jgi:hypothetical protein